LNVKNILNILPHLVTPPYFLLTSIVFELISLFGTDGDGDKVVPIPIPGTGLSLKGGASATGGVLLTPILAPEPLLSTDDTINEIVLIPTLDIDSLLSSTDISLSGGATGVMELIPVLAPEFLLSTDDTINEIVLILDTGPVFSSIELSLADGTTDVIGLIPVLALESLLSTDDTINEIVLILDTELPFRGIGVDESVWILIPAAGPLPPI
jgi:hypothetical protein